MLNSTLLARNGEGDGEESRGRRAEEGEQRKGHLEGEREDGRDRGERDIRREDTEGTEGMEGERERGKGIKGEGGE